MRARELKKKQLDEGIIDAARDVYRNTDFAKQRAQNAAASRAESQFSRNLAMLIDRAIQSGSIFEREPAPAPTSASAPTAKDFKPMSVAHSNDNAAMATGTNESRHYQIFDTLLEALIDEAPGPASVSTRQIKPGSIQNLIMSYVNQLVAKYKWQDMPDLRAHSAELAKQIEDIVSNSQQMQQILRAQGNDRVQMLENMLKTPISQLFSTMYQWEQVGQTHDKSNDESVESETLEAQLEKLSDAMKKAARDPAWLKTKEAKPFLRAMGILSKGAV